jgi:predicted HicB family RNase H-like nuclease
VRASETPAARLHSLAEFDCKVEADGGQDRDQAMNTLSYKGYSARVEFDDDDGLFLGRLAGITDGVHFHGETVEELRKAFREAVDGYVETCARVGKAPQRPYSGQLMVRISPEVHARAALAAELSGKSLAKWTEERLREDADRVLSGS